MNRPRLIFAFIMAAAECTVYKLLLMYSAACADGGIFGNYLYVATHVNYAFNAFLALWLLEIILPYFENIMGKLALSLVPSAFAITQTFAEECYFNTFYSGNISEMTYAECVKYNALRYLESGDPAYHWFGIVIFELAFITALYSVFELPIRHFAKNIFLRLNLGFDSLFIYDILLNRYYDLLDREEYEYIKDRYVKRNLMKYLNTLMKRFAFLDVVFESEDFVSEILKNDSENKEPTANNGLEKNGEATEVKNDN